LQYPLQVAPIVDDVRIRGDVSVRELTKKFDKVDLDAVCVPIEVSTVKFLRVEIVVASILPTE